MKLEQACRFRTDDVGYRICARSPGVTGDHERELSYFNSTMSVLFSQSGGQPRMGQSILHYTHSEEGDEGSRFFILARHTMRSDIKGRASIFTHACFAPLEQYRLLAAEDPAALFGLSVEPMLTAQTGESQLEVRDTETMPRHTLSLGALREKYRLDDGRYARLLALAWEALTEDTSLCIDTQLPPEETETMVQELAFCVACGLLPGLRWKLTCCSATDARATLCVASRDGGKTMGAADAHFALEGTAQDEDEPEDGFVGAFFRRIATCPEDEREALLTRVQQRVETLLPVERASAALIAACWHRAEANAAGWDGELQKQILTELLLCGKRQEVQETALDGALLETLHDWHWEQEPLPRKLLQLLLERSFRTGEAAMPFRDGLCTLLARLRPEDGLELLERNVAALLRPEQLPQLKALLDRILSAGALPPEPLALHLAESILAQRTEALAEPCMALTGQLSGKNCAALAGQILIGAEERALLPMEQDALNALLGRLLELGGEDRLDSRQERMLDSHFAEYDESLLDTCTAYCLNVRLDPRQSPEVCVALLERLEQEQPQWFARVRQALLAEGNRFRELWSRYQTRRLLTPCTSYADILRAAERYEGERAPMDIFEQKCVELWVRIYRESLRPGDLQEQMDRLSLMNQQLEQSRLSVEAQDQAAYACLGVLIEYSSDSTLLFELVVKNSRDQVMSFLQRIPEEYQRGRKGIFVETMSRFWNAPQDASPVLHLLELPGYASAERQELRELLFRLAQELAKEKAMLSWDLLLSACQVTENGRSRYDCALLLRKMQESGSFGQALETVESLGLEQSVLLRTQEGLRGELRKAASRTEMQGCDRLVQELKGGKEPGLVSSLRDKMSALRKGLEKGKHNE